MKSQLLVTAIGEDRPGIVARLTEVFVKHNGNLEESRMAILGGEFAAVILVSVPEERAEALKHELLHNLNDESISVTIKPTKPIDQKRFAEHALYEIALSGADHEGIVHKVSAFLRDRSINIQTMDTSVVNAPVTGTPLFCMKAVVAVPPSIVVSELQQSLQKIGDDEIVEITVTAPAELKSKIMA